jgi:cytochrome c553
VKTVLHLLAAFVVLVTDWIFGTPRTPETPRAPIVRFVVKHPWMTAAALAAGAAAAAALVVVSGVVPIRASSGHWPVTAWLLDFAKLRSVKTYSLWIQSPPLDDAALIVRGAAHYRIACEPCHGSPAAVVPPVMLAMTPPPPELTGERLTRWTPEQLYSIVKHGIKFTGMPAWPVQQRDDEVWAMVAFLTRLPAIDRAEYRSLAASEAATDTGLPTLPVSDGVPPPPAVRDLCWRCHGVDGTGRDPGAFPSLAGQRAAYLEAALRAFAERTRFSGTMVEIATKLTGSDMRQIGVYYERLPPGRAASTLDPAAAARGAAIATKGVPQRDVPPCAECHGPTDVAKNPAYPLLAGQHARYLTTQLGLLKQRRRGGSPRVNLMHPVADRLTDAEMREVAGHYASMLPR